ncbi:MAG: hypothetical protein Q8L74_09200 [Nitrospirota bacterium]|nr:hypothetical protein [Nitrospirota bacterium]MDP2384605.1 hypothetical protein [Nitrospirota bacterium]MDP3596156.1 hypothetical protein [Nitrospirota bacterium]
MGKEDKGKVRMTVIHFETESDNATLQENIRAIAGTLARALAPQQRVPATTVQLSSPNQNVAVTAEEDQQADVLDDGVIERTSLSGVKKQNGVRYRRTPQPVEVDLSKAPMPLKEFIEEKNPEGENKRYLAIMYWFKKYRSIESVTMDHAYTGYRHMGWQVPADAGQPFRNMKSKQYGWVGSSGKGAFTINHLGENQVEKMGKSIAK